MATRAYSKDDFELLKVERSGGMSRIQQARLKETGEICALKFGRVESADDAASASFAREVKALTDMEHRHVVRLIGIGSDGMQRFLVLEWLEETLADYIQDIGPLQWSHFYESIGRPILEALQYAHRRQFVHRDLKPLNVMFNRRREAKITDFGIARAMDDVRMGLTFAGVGSVPWTPGERDDGLHSERRDLYSWAAICVACLSGRLNYKSVAELREAAEKLGGTAPPILRDCLADAPSARPVNATSLLWTLDDFHAGRLDKAEGERAVGIELSSQVHNQLDELLPDEPADMRVARLFADFAGGCDVSRLPEGDLEFAGRTLCMRAARGSLDTPWVTVKDVRAATVAPPLPATMRTTIRFVERLGASTDVNELRANINFLETFLATAGDRAKEEQRLRDEERYLNMLQDVVAARMRALRELPTIAYDSGKWDGGDYRVSVHPDEELKLGEKRVIRTNKAIMVFEVARRDRDRSFLRPVGQRRQQVPTEGQLRVDTVAQRRALERQEEAVKSLRADTAVMPALKRLILKPGQAESPESGGRKAPDDLSADKALVLEAALGLRQLLVVEGPPGTGKTTLIAAVVKQYLHEHPGARVLIAAQTHVAIDHVIGKLMKVPELTGRIVRIARADEDKVAEDVRPALLDRCLTGWCEEAADKSRQFVRMRGAAIGLKASDVELSVRLEALRRACERQRMKSAERVTEQSKLAAAESTALSAPAGDVQEVESATVATLTVAELETEIAQLEEHIVRLRGELRQLGPDGATLADLPEAELQEWMTLLEQSNELWVRFRRELELQVGWLDLLGQLKQFEEVVLRGAAVVAGTCVGLGSSEAFSTTRFDLCIIDEASKAQATEALIPMVRSQKCLIVGDPKQLPPFDGDPVDVDGYSAEEVKETLLDYLIPRLPKECVHRLTHQHRMCASIGSLISDVFYDGSLVNERPDTDRPEWIRKKFAKPVLWMDTKNAQQRRQGTTYVNPGEQEVVLSLLGTLQHGASRAKKKASVAVIAGYAAQAHALDSRIQRDSFASLSIEVATVDSFQGRESDVCIFSVTLSNSKDFLGFLRSMNRLNVALSRPRDLLVIVGNQQFCYQAQGQNPFVRVIDFIDHHNASCETRNASQ